MPHGGFHPGGGSTTVPQYGPFPGWSPYEDTSPAIAAIFAALPPNVRTNGRQINEYQWYDATTGLVYFYEPAADGSPSWRRGTLAESKEALDVATGGSAGSGTRLASDDPRYWANLDRQFQLDVQTLAAQMQNNGLDAESARQQALTTLIANRNNTALGVAQTSLSAAEAAAKFAANPRDAVAELIYRNQVGGVTPFGDIDNSAFGEYGKALAAKAASIFQPVSADLNAARTYRDAIPPVEYYGPEIRAQLGLPPTGAQSLIGGTGAASPAAATAPALAPYPNIAANLQALPPGALAPSLPRSRNVAGAGGFRFAGGGSVKALDLDGIFDSRQAEGYTPPSSEGGTNLNIHERAVIVGESGHVYGTLGEKRPDGTIRSEQLIIKPLKSETEKDKRLAEAGKAITETQKQTMASFAGGGSATSTPEDFMQQLSLSLSRQGGAYGGTGSYSTPLPSLRLLAGAPANALEDDPVLQDWTLAGYSALGIDPRTVGATIRKFTPASAQLAGQTGIRTSY